MLGKLYVVGVGPGNPELLTIKAARVLCDISCIFVPKGREEGESLALSIIKGEVVIEGKEIVEAYFPMRKTKNLTGADDVSASDLAGKWARTVDELQMRLSRGKDIAFITIGDPSIYSTFFYLYERLIELMPELTVEIVPGISSVNASAARVNIPLGLGDGRIAILPANYLSDLKKTLNDFDTVVLMKINTVFKELVKILDETGLKNKAIIVSRAFMSDERIIYDLDKLDGEDMSYFSLMIVRK